VSGSYNSATTEFDTLTSKMKQITTFIDVGWDFTGESNKGHDRIWQMCKNGTGYPNYGMK
jgi:hypothetical protein